VELFGGRFGGSGRRRRGRSRRRRTWLRGIGRPVMPSAVLTDPELVRLPRRSRRRIPQIHLLAATLTANRETHIAHATDSIVVGNDSRNRARRRQVITNGTSEGAAPHHVAQ
jgi:hypothetical protein